MSRFDGHVRDLGNVASGVISSVSERLSTVGHLWATDTTKFVTNFSAAEHIVLKFPDNYPNSHTPASYRRIWAEWEDLLSPIISEVVGRLRLGAFETSKIMFTRLKAGGRIATHIDANPSSAVPHKIHIPVITHPNVVFHIDGVPYHLEVGRAYEVNNLLPHSVANNSHTERVHFIFDCFPVDRAPNQ